jgi:hypothetical protein
MTEEYKTLRKLGVKPGDVVCGPDTPKLWQDMSPEEKGALEKAHHEGKVIEVAYWGTPWMEKTVDHWHPHAAYRIRPETKRETVK